MRACRGKSGRCGSYEATRALGTVQHTKTIVLVSTAVAFPGKPQLVLARFGSRRGVEEASFSDFEVFGFDVNADAAAARGESGKGVWVSGAMP